MTIPLSCSPFIVKAAVRKQNHAIQIIHDNKDLILYGVHLIEGAWSAARAHPRLEDRNLPGVMVIRHVR